jgi:PAS domain S-box-containing protein
MTNSLRFLDSGQSILYHFGIIGGKEKQLFSKNVIWNGKPQHQFIYNDITERKKAEQALKVSEMNFRNSLDSSLIGIRISDKEDQTSYINQAMLNIFGYESIEEVRTNPPWKHYTPESYASFVLRHEKFLLGEPMPDHVEIDVIRKDSAIRHLDVSMKGIFWDGKQQFQTLYNDITERKQAEKALQESEEKYRLIVENSRDMIFTINANEQYVYVSPSVTKMLGYNPTDLIGKSFLSLVHPEDRHFIEEETRLSYLPGYSNSTDNEYRIRDASGEWRWVLTRGTRVIDNNGKFVYFLGISRDITERQKAEQELHESEEKYRLIVENSRDVIFTFNTAGEFTYVSPSVSKELGYQPAELIGKHIWSFIHPEEASIIKNAVQLNIANGPLNREGIEYRFRHASGEWHWYLGKGSTAHDANGNFINFTGIGRDITENKQSEDKLKQAAREWRTTFDSISDLISIHDKNNRIVRVNKTVADLLKTTPQELIGKSCREVMHGDQECPANCPHLLALKTGKPSSIEIFNSRLGLHLQESASPLFDEKGEITGTVLVARDVTQEKRMEEQLVMTDRLASIGELSSGIAHELNNPLTSVIGFSQLLMEGDVPDDIREDLGIVHSEAQRAAAIVKNLLTFARKHAPVKELSNVNAVVEDVLRLRSYEQKVNNIEVENRLSPNLPEIMIDHFQMQQVFLNIMVNAEFAMQEAHHKGKLVVTTEKLDGTIRISFADDGPGISQENLKHIFDPFFTTKEVGKGTGLGLSICHGIVTEHGGQIYATSEKGQGATFVVELPLINEQ